jgi:hypothetical protein
VGLVEPEHEPVEEGLVVETVADDGLRHRDEHGSVRSRPDRMCSSDICALVRVARGSTETMRTPRSRAQRRYCGLFVPKVPSAGLQPQRIMRRELT